MPKGVIPKGKRISSESRLTMFTSTAVFVASVDHRNGRNVLHLSEDVCRLEGVGVEVLSSAKRNREKPSGDQPSRGGKHGEP